MDKQTAMIMAENLVGQHSGEHCMKPNNSASHSMFKAALESQGVDCTHGYIPYEDFAKLLIMLGNTILANESPEQ